MGGMRIVAITIFLACCVLLAYKQYDNSKGLEDRNHPVNRAACEFNGKC